MAFRIRLHSILAVYLQAIAERDGRPAFIRRCADRFLFTGLVVATFCMMSVVGSHSAVAADEVDFQRDIAPLLTKYCVGCHTADDANGELNLNSYETLMVGGEHGLAVTPGEPASSRLFLLTAGREEPKMPPDEMEGPNEEDLALLERWIEAGAKGPDGSAPQLDMAATPQIPPADASQFPVTALATSADGRWLAIGRFGTAQLLRGDTRQVAHEIKDLPGKVNDLRFSSDGRLVVIASGVTGLRGAATVVEVSSGKTLVTIAGHSDTLYAAALSPDGKTVATGGYDAVPRLWDAASGQLLRELAGHNGAIYDLSFTSDGQVLATASGDETVKLWRVTDGERLDTLSQPQGDVTAVAFAPDDQFVVAASTDQRFRAWRFVSRTQPQINPLVETRFADDSPLVELAFTPDGKQLLIASQAGRISLFETSRWTKTGTLPEIGDTISQFAIIKGQDIAAVATMAGEFRELPLPSSSGDQTSGESQLREVHLVVDTISEVSEPADAAINSPESALRLPRGARAKGVITAGPDGASQADWYRFTAREGEVWMVEVRAEKTASGSTLDSLVEVADSDGNSLTRARLQAVRASYFTFRGKDSNQSNDYRLFDWEEMRLDDFLYSAGEVTRLWMYPRGPDSGFNVYPGVGTRWTYFDTSAVTHALQEPAYVVRPLGPTEPAIDNGLPVFEIPYLNDDDAQRELGTDSRLRFVAPHDGEFTIRVDDTRGLGSATHGYQLTIRPASPDFTPSVGKIGQPIPAGAGREFSVQVKRIDGYDGPVEFQITGLPAGVHATQSVVVEAGQREAFGVVWVDADAPVDQVLGTAQIVARAQILGRMVEHQVGELGEIKVAAPPRIAVQIVSPAGEVLGPAGNPIEIKRGETIAAEVRITRNGFDGDLKLGNEFAGRNMPYGVFVDNIGLNGLLVPKGFDRQQFFITCDPVAAPGVRYFHLKAEIDGGVTSVPIPLQVH